MMPIAAPLPGHLLPPSAFTSAEQLTVELGAIFERSWVHVADLPDLARPGDFVAATIGVTPVVIVRDGDGELRGFLNACRHRGTTLVEGAGHCGPTLRCPYHAWTYSTTGRLQGVPHREEFGCRADGLDLVPIRVGAVGPMVFGCLDATAPSLAEWVGELGPALVRARGAAMESAFTLEYDVAANWKVYVENGLDGYHVPFVHDFLSGFIGNTAEARNFYEEHASYTLAPVSAEFGGGEVRFGHVFPNLIPVLSPVDFAYLRIDPVAPDRIRLRARSFDLGGDVAATRELRREAQDRTNKQDIAVVERVQRGLNARGLPAGVHSDVLEARIAHFEKLLVRSLSSS